MAHSTDPNPNKKWSNKEIIIITNRKNKMGQINKVKNQITDKIIRMLDT